MTVFTKLLSCFLSVIAFFCSLFNIPFYAIGDEVNLNKFTMTFSDEFNGTELDRNIWSGHFQYGNNTIERKGCFWNNNLVQVKDGNLIIPCIYLKDGMGGKGSGWYSAGIDTDGDVPSCGFSQKYGYFECRCKLPEGTDIWSAFWLFCDGVCNENGDGQDGTEIDIMESYKGKEIQHNLHYNGYDDAHKSMGTKRFKLRNDPVHEYNTYGLEWNENEYIFYINGKESMRTSFGGVSKVPEFLVLSLEMNGKNAIPAQRKDSTGDSTAFLVDYVRVYQYNDLLNK